jgi:hypothetical protein
MQLTTFSNNVSERALKKAILHRKNALFYRTANGARVGDLFISLIHTAELCGANPFDYLTELQRNASALAQAPARWMPWNYRTISRRSRQPPPEQRSFSSTQACRKLTTRLTSCAFSEPHAPTRFLITSPPTSVKRKSRP